MLLQNLCLKLMTAANLIQGFPQQAQMYPKWESLLKKLFLGLDIEDAVKTDAEVKAEMEQEMAMQAATQVATSAGQAAAQAAVQQ